MYIKSTYTDKEYSVISEKASALGLTVSAYQKQLVIQALFPEREYSAAELVKMLREGFKKLETNKIFLVSELFEAEVWKKLSPSEKKTAAKQLSRLSRLHEDVCCCVGKTSSNTKRYKKLEEEFPEE